MITTMFRHYLSFLFKIARATKLGIELGSDVMLVALASFLAVFFSQYQSGFSQNLGVFLGVVVMVRVGVFFSAQLYSLSWRFASTRQFKRLYGAVLGGSVLMLGIFAVGDGSFLSNGLLFQFVGLEFLGTLCFIFSFRGLLRLLRDELLFLTKQASTQSLVPVLVLGAGAAGAMIANESFKNPSISYEIKGFLDDNLEKTGQLIHGVKVLGPLSKLGHFVDEYCVKEVVIAMPSAESQMIRALLNHYKELDVRFKITPSLQDLISGKSLVQELREIKIQDLLGRHEVDQMIIDQSNNYINDKVVLVTGGGGSIGSELCLQLLRFQPKQLIVFDNCEDHVYQIDREIRQRFPEFSGLRSVVGDVACDDDLRSVFQTVAIDVVFHAAAYKHVPLMEYNVNALMKNNIRGTRLVLEHSKSVKVDRFILISTDKAVNPTNSMGASKRFCELLTLAYAREYGVNFSAVRFGNVLGSRGSVVPLFKEQIEKGGPITVTHPDITRYFMTIPEASRLVLQAGLLSAGGEVFTLDMGEPIKIVDLAKDMIRLSHESEDRIDIVFTGLRPGEKMYEELSYDVDTIQKTVHAKIFVETEQGECGMLELDRVLGSVGVDKTGEGFGLLQGLGVLFGVRV